MSINHNAQGKYFQQLSKEFEEEQEALELEGAYQKGFDRGLHDLPEVTDGEPGEGSFKIPDWCYNEELVGDVIIRTQIFHEAGYPPSREDPGEPDIWAREACEDQNGTFIQNLIDYTEKLRTQIKIQNKESE